MEGVFCVCVFFTASTAPAVQTTLPKLKMEGGTGVGAAMLDLLRA